MKRGSTKRSREKEDPLLLKMQKNQKLAIERNAAKVKNRQVKLEAFLKALPPPPQNVHEIADKVISVVEKMLEEKVHEQPRVELTCFSRASTLKCVAFYEWEEAMYKLDKKGKHCAKIDTMFNDAANKLKMLITEKWVKKHPKIASSWSWISFIAGNK